MPGQIRKTLLSILIITVFNLIFINNISAQQNIPVKLDLANCRCDFGLFNAVKRGDITSTKTKIADCEQAGVKIKYLPLLFYTALNKGEAELIKLLLVKKAPADNFDLSKAIFIAVENSHYEVIKALLAAGADAKAVTDKTLLEVSAQHKGTGEIAKLLINAGADVNFQDSSKFTALILAAENNNSEFINALLSAHVNLHAVNFDNDTALTIAIRHRATKIVNLLLAAEPEMQANDDRAISDYKTRFKGYVPGKQVMGDSSSKLTFAAENNDLDTVKMLVTLEMPSTWMSNPALAIAAKNGNAEMVRVLIPACGYISSYQSHSALYWAVNNGAIDIVELLLPVKNYSDITDCFYLAAERGYDEIIDLLITNTTYLTEMALVYAAKTSNIRLMKKLINAGFKKEKELSDSALIESARIGNVEAVKLLLSAGANLYHINPYYETAMKVAIINNKIEVVKILVKAMEDVKDAFTPDDLTPLRMAVEYQQPEIIEFLTKAGADTSFATIQGSLRIKDGEPMTGTNLTNLHLVGNYHREEVTDEAGDFVITVPAGDYSLNFDKFVQINLTLKTSQVLSLNAEIGAKTDKSFDHLFSCLSNRSLDQGVSFRVETSQVLETVRDRLIKLKAHCKNGKLIDMSGKEIIFENPNCCCGIEPSTNQILTQYPKGKKYRKEQKKAEEKARIAQENYRREEEERRNLYTIIVIGCNHIPY